MIETALKNYLDTGLESVPVMLEYPKKQPKQFVVLQLADSGKINHIDAATFFITVYDTDSLYEAAVLKEKVKDLLFDAISLPGISNSSIGQERAGTDSANHIYKYDLTFNFYYYREET